MSRNDKRLLGPAMLGPLSLPNRMVMAPMTRTRADTNRVPTPMMAEYYAQRSSAGLIITECTAVSADSAGIIRAPGIYTNAHVRGWRRVTDAVHDKGGRIFMQIWHGGRCSHVSLQPNGGAPVAPSAIRADGLIFLPGGRVPYSEPRALTLDEIPHFVQLFADATKRARDAGFDGVELHGAYGYLPDQFLEDGTNQRTDRYGGSIENRARFLFEVIESMTRAWSADRIGVKLSPSNRSYGMFDSNALKTFSHAIQGLSDRGILYLHLMEPDQTDFDKGNLQVTNVLSTFRPLFKGTVIANCRFDKKRAEETISAGLADFVSFGRLYLANPDLPERFATGGPFNTPDFATFYGDGPKGYLDYPALG